MLKPELAAIPNVNGCKLKYFILIYNH